MSEFKQYYENLRPEVAELLPASYSRVLEIGCGDGNFRSNLKKENEYWGIEPVHACVVSASTKLNRVLEGLFDDVAGDLPDSYFDLVVCNDVIEHMWEPEIFLQNIKSKISDDASLVFSIPNVRYITNLYEVMIKKDWRYADQGILDRTHMRFYTVKSMRRLFEQCGYEVEEDCGINGIGDARKGLNGFLYRSAGFFMQCMFGGDIKYPQFAFRVKVK